MALKFIGGFYLVMGVVRDLTGQVFHGILLIRVSGIDKHNKRIWECKCHCGKIYHTVGASVTSGHSKSCGCSTRFHGDHGTVFYNRWVGMKNRCFKPKDNSYIHYGARGITVCERWLNYLNFKEDMYDTFKPELSLDRLNVNGNYEPGNCQWRTITEQNRNKRNNTIIDTPWGKMTIIEACERSGIKETAMHYRIRNQPPELWFIPKYQSWKLK